MTDIQEVNPYLELGTPKTSKLEEDASDHREAGDSSPEFRQVFINCAQKNDELEYCSNVVITSKYTVWTFLPKFLFESFKKLANAYFLLVSILQCIPGISNTGGIPTNAPVLLFILSVDAVLAIIEDKRRHAADKEANSATCQVVNEDGGCSDLPWADLRVGRIVKLRNREFAPADLLILAVAEPNPDEMSGICYVETKSLDGETNLKLRQAVELTLSGQSHEQITAYSGVVQSELPNTAISKFNATISLDDDEESEMRPITINNMILRGCQLRNTDWIYGLALNTGNDTKIMQSAVKAPSKWSSINIVVNKMIVWLFWLLVALCATAATVQVVWNQSHAVNANYLDWDPTPSTQWFEAFGSYFLLLYQIIPVSLYVSISMVMFFQSLFMVMDIEMYHEESNTRAIVRSMGLNEELGQVSYVFSDKTGTLTCNVMDFRKCCIDGVSYGTGTTEIGRAARLREGKAPIEEPAETKSSTPYVNFDDPKLDALLSDAREATDEPTKEQQRIVDFFTHLAICHTVIPEKLSDGEIRLSASSPDEQALVAGAKYFGFEFDSRGSKGLARIRVHGNVREYQVLDVLEFNSDRKRMSVIVKDPSGNIQVLCKGADTALKPRLRQTDDSLWDKTEALMVEYADEGLRTLVIASKTIDNDEYEAWGAKFKQASSDIEQIEKRKQGDRENEIDRLMEEMETGFDLLGVTAIEDKLQDGVPATIAKLSQASIKVWMLTGDKQETAINIAYACQLVNNDMQQIILDASCCESDEMMRSRLSDHRASMRRNQDMEHALVIDGEALELALTEAHVQSFLAIALECKGVVCCRVSPSQKAQIVQLVRRQRRSARTLAIGDGANDVAMIQKAHIGVGISGQEGMQAVNSSDYAIAQFRYLQKLLLHHGRLNYMRMSKLVGYMFYKNTVMVLAQYYYMFLTGTSGQKFYNELGFQLYNMCYTSLPIIYLGVFDYDVPSHVSRMYPQLYFPGPKMELFNTFVFLKWMSAAIFESCVIFVFTVYGYNDQIGAVGNADIASYGLVAFTLVVLICNLKILLMQLSWTPLAAGLWLAGIFSWMPVSILIASNWIELFPQDFGTFQNTLSTPIFWIALPVAFVTALGRHYTWTAFQRMVFPTLSQIVQEKFVLGKITAPTATSHECEEELRRHDEAFLSQSRQSRRGSSRVRIITSSQSPTAAVCDSNTIREIPGLERCSENQQVMPLVLIQKLAKPKHTLLHILNHRIWTCCRRYVLSI